MMLVGCWEGRDGRVWVHRGLHHGVPAWVVARSPDDPWDGQVCRVFAEVIELLSCLEVPRVPFTAQSV